jgi:uridylate kinase
MSSAKRVLLKLSGEWFAGKKEKGFDEKTFERISSAIDFTKQKKNSTGDSLRRRKYLSRKRSQRHKNR